MDVNKSLVKTYIYRDDGSFFVSTIDRDSSSMLGGRYAETLVFQWDAEKDNILKQLAAGLGGGK